MSPDWLRDAHHWPKIEIRRFNKEETEMMVKIRHSILFILFLLASEYASSQSHVAITIDDIPNGTSFSTSGNRDLLNTLDTLNIPICIFINEGKLPGADSIARQELLRQWISRKYITLGNHTFSHFHYSEVGFDVFTDDIRKGEILTKKLAKENRKKLEYFRFPFNDLGIDSIQHQAIHKFLQANNYKVAPFTIESMDWMYNAVYEHYLSKKEPLKAANIGQDYVKKTLEYFAFFDEMTTRKYGRKINQIYLCHDNLINANYLPAIVQQLRSQNYQFISLKEALKDKVYRQEDSYAKKWGISWIYRWEHDSEARKELMKKEPNTEEIEQLYNSIQAQGK